jgi:hypothetical protein
MSRLTSRLSRVTYVLDPDIVSGGRTRTYDQAVNSRRSDGKF